VSRKVLEGKRLVSDKTSFKPVFGDDDSGAQGDEHVLSNLRFWPVLPELTSLRIELPKDFKDASGRSLRNAANFPLKVATGAMPPLAKFAAAPFGIVERFAEPNGAALLPVTLRNVEAALAVQALNAAQAAGPAVATAKGQASRDSRAPLPKVLEKSEGDRVQTRTVSLLQGQAGGKTLDLPQPAIGASPPPRCWTTPARKSRPQVVSTFRRITNTISKAGSRPAPPWARHSMCQRCAPW
jgi:hypothetical protein